MVFKRLINISSKEGESRGETVNNCEYVDNFPSRTTLNTLRKRLTFSRKDHNIILRQFGAWLTIYTEEPFGCLLGKSVLPTAREENRLRKLRCPIYIGQSLMKHKYGAKIMVSCRKLITSKVCSRKERRCSYVCTECRC